MEFLGATVTNATGESEDRFFLRCEEHNWFYSGRPPITTGCRECWLAYYTGQLAQKGGDFRPSVDQLESAIRHAAELADKGEFDFEPRLEDFKVEHEEDI
jgi:hypothetical protein